MIATPEVYTSPSSKCYIVFGEAKVEDMNAGGPLAASSLASAAAANVSQLEKSGVSNDDEVPELEPVEEEGPIDETGLVQEDIKLVMQQVDCSRRAAVKALREANGDLINASTCFHGTIRVYLLKTCFCCSYDGKQVSVHVFTPRNALYITLLASLLASKAFFVGKHPSIR